MDNRSETTALTSGSGNHCRNCENSKTLSITRQKFWYGLSSVLVLCLLLLSTALIFQSNKSGTECDLSPVGQLTSTLSPRVLISTPKEADPCIRAGGRRKKSKKCREKEETSHPVEPFAKQIIGHYKQVELVNMEAYLDAEGGNWMYKRMAQSVMPNLEIKQYSDVKYGQIYTAPLYSNEWIMFTDGREYHHEDALGDPVVATAIDTGDQLKIVALGGKAGPMKTIMSWENKRLKMELTLIDQDNVTAVRYFQPV